MHEIILDTETTGLSFREGHKIVEIACIETKDLVPTGNVFHRLINPKRSVPEAAFKIHGFSTEFLKLLMYELYFLISVLISFFKKLVAFSSFV